MSVVPVLYSIRHTERLEYNVTPNTEDNIENACYSHLLETRNSVNGVYSIVSMSMSRNSDGTLCRITNDK